MRSGKMLTTLALAAMLSASGSFAQSSNVLTRVEIVVASSKIAARQSVQDLIEDLAAAGFTYIEIHRTFLGRARIIAYSAKEIREVIINPTTGEVLRDLVQENMENLSKPVNSHAAAAGGNVNTGGTSNNGHGNRGNNGNSNNGNNNNGNNGNNGHGNNGNAGGGNNN